MRKVNIDTDLRMASTGAIRQFFNKNRKKFDPRKYLAEATKARMKGICSDRYQAFGTAGNASKIKAVSWKMTDPLRQGRAERDREVSGFLE